MITAAASWGVSSAIVAHAGFRGAFSYGIVALAAAVALWLLSLKSSDVRLPPIQTLLLLGLLEAINIATYFAALREGPTAPVVAMHLSSPLVITLGSIALGRRRFGRTEILGVAALVLGIGTLALGAGNQRPDSHLAAALLLAAASACAVAVLIVLVSRLSANATVTRAAAGQLGIAAAVLLLSGYAGGASVSFNWEAVLAGALFLGPGFALYWRAAAWLPARTTATIGLLEAVFAAVAGAAWFGSSLRVKDLASAALIGLAVAIQSVEASGAGISMLKRRVRPREGST
jgi:drug/metabolite transporter (DMT)-like permease